ncbi:Kinase domain protein, partial [Paragonimus heterotremus]
SYCYSYAICFRFTVSAENAQTPISPTPPAGIKVHLKRLLGSGANGFCHEVELIPLDCQDDRLQTTQMNESGYENLPRQAALKVLPFDVYQSKGTAIHREITTQRHLTHSNVLKLFWAYKEQRLQAVCLLLEYCSMGSLMDLFDSVRTSFTTPESMENDDSDKKTAHSNSLIHDPTTGVFPYSLSRTIFRGMMLGLSYLHDEHGIVHRDIKPSNVLLADGFVAKLSDFGLACSEQQCLTEKSQICGTPNYLAPEVFLKEGHSKASDCWAAGATLYFMLCGRPPFQSLLEQTDHFLTEKLEQRRVSGATVRQPSNRSAAVQVRSICRNLLWGRYTFRSSLNQAARQTICALLRRAPTARPTATKVLSMDFCTKSVNSRSVRIAEQAVVERGTWSSHTEASRYGLLDTRNECKTTDGQVGIQDSIERKHIPIDRVFDENRASSVENVTIDANEENISMHRTVRQVGDTVYTGNRAVYDVFKLLFVRVNNHVEREPQRELVLHWVSRWALTNHPLLYYTLDEVLLRQTVGDVNNPEMHTELCLPSREESWGVTNQTGQGLMQFKGQRVIQFEHNATSNNSVTSQLPSMVDVRTHCEFLIRQLKHFSPISLQFSSIPQDPTELAVSTDQSTSPVDPATDNVNPVFVQRWRDHGNNVIFSFSTGGWQVNFHDHSKLIIHYPYLLVYADPGVSTVNSHTYHVLTSYDQLESEFRTWILLHSHLKSILQILLFTLL